MRVGEISFTALGGQSGWRLETCLWVPRPREEVFSFFSDAFELESLTPSWLNFAVLTPRPIEMRPGITIDYRLRLRGMPLRWRSRIAAWEPPVRFVDEQVRGPYRRWWHEHTFEEREGGTHCRDVVEYNVWGGRLVNAILVRRDLRRIFQFRHEKLWERFGART